MSTATEPAVTPLLLNAREVAAMLGLSERSLWRMDSSQELPAGFMLRGAKRWRAEEIRAWIDAGMPMRAVWEKTRKK